MDSNDDHRRKKPRLNHGSPIDTPAMMRLQRSVFPSTLSRRVSPPLPPKHENEDHSGRTDLPSDPACIDLSRSSSEATTREHPYSSVPEVIPIIDVSHRIATKDQDQSSTLSALHDTPPDGSRIQSPFRLTRIPGLPAPANIDTISIREILGDPLIKEAWVFNYCFDVDWLMKQFDPDVRNLVEVIIVHGSWRREDVTKIHIDDACQRYSNVKSIQAYLPDAFGTHHSKTFVLIRHDETAQIVIHTANMIECDWGNTTQAVWCSPLLPRLTGESVDGIGILGSGTRFKEDLLTYLGSYGRKKLARLSDQLKLYDFSSIRGVLIASVPSKIRVNSEAGSKVWGYLALKHALEEMSQGRTSTDAEIVCQVSSIANFKKEWLTETLFRALAPRDTPRFFIIFPTGEEVQRSLNGYGGGASIHFKTRSAAHKKQAEFLLPYLCHWKGSKPKEDGAQRGPAAPHIKTYIRFAPVNKTSSTRRIEWALLTSANLSIQAWGTSPKPPNKKEKAEGLNDSYVQVQSYELGVLVWPELFGGKQDVLMVPVFGRDTPDHRLETQANIIGLRMPYDLPLEPYGKGECPWSSNLVYPEPDSLGNTWPMSFA